MGAATRGAWALGTALALVMVSGAAAFEDPHGVGYDGRDWKAMSEEARLAYVAGFLAGTATQQAIQRHRVSPKTSVDAAVSEIVRLHTGSFPFGVNVYTSDLHDYYFYVNNQRTKIYQALLEENARMLKRPGAK